jgi:hypothetical protein
LLRGVSYGVAYAGQQLLQDEYEVGGNVGWPKRRKYVDLHLTSGAWLCGATCSRVSSSSSSSSSSSCIWVDLDGKLSLQFLHLARLKEVKKQKKRRKRNKKNVKRRRISEGRNV